MKIRIFILSLLVLSASMAYGEDTKTTALTENADYTSDDLVYCVDDPASAKNSRKCVISTVFGTATDLDSGGAVSANAVALTTDTTGNYAATVTGGTGVDSTGATTGEGITHTLSFDSTEIDATTWSDSLNASNIWTFDVSGTDHTMTAGSGLMTFSNAVTVTGALTAALTGNSDTATALAANPADCAANQFADTIAANGDLTCAAIIDADVPNDITIDLATAATALAANPTDCGANSFATTIAASGNLTCSTPTLATDTNGNYVATLADAGSSTITVVNGTAEGGAATVDAVDLNCTDCLNATEIEDIYVLNAGDTMTGALVVDGSANAVQLTVQANGTQTNDILVVENSAGTDIMTGNLMSIKIASGIEFITQAGASPTLVATGGISVDTTNDQLKYVGANNTVRTLAYERERCVTLEDLTPGDDNLPFFSPKDDITVTSGICHCVGTCTTPAILSLEVAEIGSAVITNIGGELDCQDITTGDTLSILTGVVAGIDLMRFDVDNSPSPETDNYTFCFYYETNQQ